MRHTSLSSQAQIRTASNELTGECCSAGSTLMPVQSRRRQVKRKYPLDPHVPSGRAAYVVDIENNAGGSDVKRSTIQESITQIFDAAPCNYYDHVIVASGPTFASSNVGLLSSSNKNWPITPRVLWGSGINGADLQLMDFLQDVRKICGLYDRIVLVSGDHIFETAANSYRSLGVEVGVVARKSALSNELANAADWVKYIPEVKQLKVRVSKIA